MFLEFFGLREQPFGVSPDPRYLYLGPAHREALASLYYGIEADRGFLSLVARPGMGKTTLLFHLLAKFSHTARTAFIFQTQCNSREFMRFLLAEIGIENESNDFVRMHEQFNRCLVQEARAGRRFIVVIDEAQNLDASVLETVRLLSDFETPQAKLLQIILVGQPSLADKLASPQLTQLRQRITSLSGLQPLSAVDTTRFIEHRLKVAGYKGQTLFTPEALALIADASEGIPRQINNYCFHSLSLACAERKKTVEIEVVREVANDLDIHRFMSEVEVPLTMSRLMSTGALSADPIPQMYESHREEGKGHGEPTMPSQQKKVKDSLTPAEAMQHMRDVARLLNNWRNGIPPSDTRVS
jgi:general secretion pathway protein A